MDKREWSEAEKAQAKMRLVRLDAEGKPVDGSAESYTMIHYVKNMYYDRVATLDAEILKTMQEKTVSLKLLNLSPEFTKLLKGESGDPVATGDSGSGPVDR